ncbi:hypothetical protein ACFLVI_03445 [Chloroflexota bacterium]
MGAKKKLSDIENGDAGNDISAGLMRLSVILKEIAESSGHDKEVVPHKEISNSGLD